MASGFVGLVLHAHLPFVRHPEHERFLEEDWLFEAVSETYLPLLRTLHKLRREGVPFQLTLSLSPTLCAMLSDSLLQKRYVAFLQRLIELGEKELERTADDEKMQELARFYLERYRENYEDFTSVYR